MRSATWRHIFFFFVKEVPLIVFDIEFIIKENENTFFFFFKEFMFVKKLKW